MYRPLLRRTGVAVVTGAAFFSTSAPRKSPKSQLGALSAQHSSVPFSEAQTVACIAGLGRGDMTPADTWTALRVVASSEYMVPLVDNGLGPEAKGLMTFPSGVEGAPMVLGAFTAGAFKGVVESNPEQKIEGSRVTAQDLVDFMEDLTNEEKASANPAALVGFLSFNAALAQAWDSETRTLWRQLLGAVKVRTGLQRAETPPEINAALREALLEGSFWMAESKGPGGKYAPTAADIGGKATMLAFCAYDLLLRHEEGAEIRVQQIQGKKILALMQGGFDYDMAIVHDVLEDGRLGFITLTKERADRIAKLK